MIVDSFHTERIHTDHRNVKKKVAPPWDGHTSGQVLERLGSWVEMGVS